MVTNISIKAATNDYALENVIIFIFLNSYLQYKHQ